jgi:AraC-like DNA-binding protein
MTADANRLTSRATASNSAGPPVPVGQFRPFVEAFERLGYPVESVLAALQVGRARLLDPDALIPCEAMGGLFAQLLSRRPLPNLGLRLGAETSIGAYPLIDYLAVTSDNVGQALQQLARYFRLLGTPVRLDIDDSTDPLQVRFQTLAPDPANGFGAEYTAALQVLHLRRETDGRARFEYVAFTHQPDDLAEAERILGCPVRPGSAWSGVALTRETWQLPMRRRDPALRAVLERHAADLAARQPAGDTIEADVRRVLASRLAHGEVGLRSISRDLAMSIRTLQRRLTADGWTFEDLVDRVRRDLAERHLSESALSIAEIGYLLGYSEPAAFHRAFKRWTGSPPQAFRFARRSPTGEGGRG